MGKDSKCADCGLLGVHDERLNVVEVCTDTRETGHKPNNYFNLTCTAKAWPLEKEYKEHQEMILTETMQRLQKEQKEMELRLQYIFQAHQY